MITKDLSPTRSDRVLAQVTDGELVLLHLDRGTYFALNDVGSRIWELCDGSNSFASIIEVLAEEYEAPAELIEEDASALLTELISDELVVG